MRWVALQPKGGTISGGIYLCNQPLKVCQKCCLIGSKLFLRNPFQDCAFTSFLWKPCFFPTWVSADILYLFLSIFNIFPEPIYHQRSYFHMFLILMCWQFNFPKKKQKESTPSIQNILIRREFSTAVLSTKLTFGSWETFQGRRVTAALLIIVRI